MRSNILYVVIPCYNEEEVLLETAGRLKEKMESLMERGMISSECASGRFDDSEGICGHGDFHGCRFAG